MSTAIGANEARTHFSRLLDEVASGRTITILRHGTPGARLAPLARAAGGDAESIVEEFREARRGVRLEGCTARQLIDEARR